METKQINETILAYQSVIRGTIYNTARKHGVVLQETDLDDWAQEVNFKLASRVLVNYDPERKDAAAPRQWVAVCAFQVTCNLLARRKVTVPINSTDANVGDWGETGYAVTLPDPVDVELLLERREQYARLERALNAFDSSDADLYRAVLAGRGKAYADAHGLTPVQMSRAKKRITARLTATLTR